MHACKLSRLKATFVMNSIPPQSFHFFDNSQCSSNKNVINFPCVHSVFCMCIIGSNLSELYNILRLI